MSALKAGQGICVAALEESKLENLTYRIFWLEKRSRMRIQLLVEIKVNIRKPFTDLWTFFTGQAGLSPLPIIECFPLEKT